MDVSFTGAHGTQLAGVIDVPDTDPVGWAVIAHCFTCHKSYHAVTRLAKALNAAGIGVLRFDFAGLGKSAGRFTESTFSADVDDLVAACEWMASQGRPVGLLAGHSLGGTAALAAAARVDSLKAVVTLASPSHPSFVAKQLADQVRNIGEDGVVQAIVAGRQMLIGAPLIADLNAQEDYRQRLRQLQVPLLVLHSPQDTVVHINHANEIYRYAPMPKSFVALDGADHLMTDPKIAQWAGTLIATWAGRYLR
ncbi:MAG: alpha/beta fold hydrolase [Actinomycetaceae bacterium]|nr:alpha/beta fold hydrolase [Actinomycetaceae bacterium]